MVPRDLQKRAQKCSYHKADDWSVWRVAELCKDDVYELETVWVYIWYQNVDSVILCQCLKANTYEIMHSCYLILAYWGWAWHRPVKTFLTITSNMMACYTSWPLSDLQITVTLAARAIFNSAPLWTTDVSWFYNKKHNSISTPYFTSYLFSKLLQFWAIGSPYSSWYIYDSFCWPHKVHLVRKRVFLQNTSGLWWQVVGCRWINNGWSQRCSIPLLLLSDMRQPLCFLTYITLLGEFVICYRLETKL